MPRGRPQFGFLVIDCPSDHEIDGSLVTESQTIRAVLANKNLGSRLKIIRCTTADSFACLPNRVYSGIRYVHLGGHGSRKGLEFIGGQIPWAKVAQKLTRVLPRLKQGERRILTLSCCYSTDGIESMKPYLMGHFSAAYHFVPKKIGFSQAITVWSMFYLKKKISQPHAAIVKKLNRFLETEVIVFAKI